MKTFLEILFSFSAIVCVCIIELYVSTTSRSRKDKLEVPVYITGIIFILSILAYMVLYV